MAAAAPPPIDPGSLNTPPSPALMPEVWDSCAVGPYSFPPVPGRDGLVRVEFEEELKVDVQQSDGTDKGTTKNKGVAPTKGKLIVEWTAPIWNEGISFCMAIGPNGPNKGVPFDFMHPDAQRRNLGQIEIKKAGKLDVAKGGQRYSQTFEFEEWNPKPPDDSDGTDGMTEPERAAHWTSGAKNKGTGVDVTVPAGFLGPNAPKADP